jgi:hypothetical protein
VSASASRATSGTSTEPRVPLLASANVFLGGLVAAIGPIIALTDGLTCAYGNYIGAALLILVAAPAVALGEGIVVRRAGLGWFACLSGALVAGTLFFAVLNVLWSLSPLDHCYT